MKIIFYQIFLLLFLTSCIQKSQFDLLHSPYYDKPWDFSITSYSLGTTSVTLNWSSSTKANSYKVLYKDSTDTDFTIASSTATSPYTINSLTHNHTYTVKVVAVGTKENKESSPIVVILSNTPVATDMTPTNVLAGTSRTLTLTYTDADSDLATACSVSSAFGLDFTSNCTCSAGVCTVMVEGQAGFLGNAEFEFNVTANGQTSNNALVSFDYICPTNYVSVTTSLLSGVKSFCVMTYEAKNVAGVATSQALLTPWTSITFTNAVTQCTSLGSKYDLISNPEWMSIARGIESRTNNWSSSVVGTGMLVSGHSDSSFASNDLLAITDTTDSYNGTGNNASQAAGSGWEQRRTFNLANGNIIWDFAGNALEWVDWKVFTGGQGVTPAYKAYHSTDSGPINTPIEFNLLNLLIGSTDEMFPDSWQSTITTLTSTNRIGKYTAGNNTTGGYAKRGGMWASASEAGIYFLDLTSDSSYTSNDTGFRCVYRP
jgi:hypothetical protein